MASVGLGLRCPPCGRIDEVADFARAAERAGFDAAWFPDSQFLWRDVWATVAVAAVRTERIRLGTAVTNFETRNPAVTAAAVSTLDELARGRFRLGVGTGDSAVKTLGAPPTRLATMRESIELVRRLQRGDTVRYGGSGPYADRRMRMKAATGRSVPVYVAATGPRALRLAGEVADGVIIAAAGVAPALVEQAVGHVRRGAESAGRSLDELDVCLAAHTALAADEEAASRVVKPLVVTSAQLGGAEALRAVGIDVDVPPLVSDVYPDVTHADDWEQAIAAAERFVDDRSSHRYAEMFCLAGPPEVIARRIEAAAACGVTSFYILGTSSYRLPHDLLGAFGETVIPALRDVPAADPQSS